MVLCLPKLFLLLSLIIHNSISKMETMPYKFIINVCNKIYGHLCYGSYIHENWILITYECSWSGRDQELIALMAENSNLDCVHGQYREPDELYLPGREYLDRNHRIALVTIIEPFIMGSTSVAIIPIVQNETEHEFCTMYEYIFDDTRDDFTLKSRDLAFVNITHCRGFFPYDYEYAKKGVSCATNENEISVAEIVNLKGYSPVICDNMLQGYVIAINHSTLVVMNLEFQYGWIKFVLNQQRNMNKCPGSKLNLEAAICMLIVGYVSFNFR